MKISELANCPPPLGFGFMRLPELDGHIDIEQLKQMVDRFMAAGFTYFDTAWGYMNGKSEEAVRETVVERYPRDAFTVATKFPVWAVKEQADVRRIFDTQLQRTGAGYFDYYMLHAIGADRMPTLDKFGLWDFLKAQKQNGLAKHIGFSFHDKADALDMILQAHPEVDFVQLQLNYADWEDGDVQSRLCYEACLRHGKAVVVMEPVKGGSLAAMSPEVRQVFEAARPNRSVASWAMRYAGSLDGIITVLSGMSDVAQVEDNIKTMQDFEPLTDEDRAVIAQALAILAKTPTIPCTACRYCVEDCPQKINIPGIFENYNDLLVYKNLIGTKRSYTLFTANPVKASDCIACGACEARCPQHIPIIEKLKDCVQVFEG